MIHQKTRIRFAPSPTGLLHVGNARTALYNWLFARHTGGEFILRIEDTDLERSEARHEAQLLEDLRWLGLHWDEGPGSEKGGGGPYGSYRQSDRLEIYREHTRRLLAEGKAYRCFCTQEELEAERQRAQAGHASQVYSGRCRALDAETSSARAAAGEPFAVRLRVPDHPLRFRDLIRGEVEFASDAVSDPVLVRSSGVPVYNYVVTVDDALMRITHVIRGDDHLSNTPKQVAIYEAFGWELPVFAHLSTILGSDRERLSKRHGATSIASFRAMGILPEALLNYLALLGWGAEGGTREIFTTDELVKQFKLERVTAAPAVFDLDKLNWLNRHYLRHAETARLVQLAWPYFETRNLLPAFDSSLLPWFEALLAVMLPAVDRLDQLPERARFLFDFHPDEESAEMLSSPAAQAVVAAFSARVRAHAGPVSAAQFKAWMNEVKTETGAKGKELFHPVRILLTGSHSGPEFDKIIPLIEEGGTVGLAIASVRERVEAAA